jgi:hypothetical protein
MDFLEKLDRCVSITMQYGGESPACNDIIGAKLWFA